MKFICKVWHPNISSQTGAICLDILKDQWSPALTIKTALLSLQALLFSPEPSDPQDAEVANMYLTNYEKFAETAKFWTECHAMGKGSNDGKVVKKPVNPIVMKLMEMGFEEESCVAALLVSKGDEGAAIETLLSGM
jgi:ubiquitin-conjugating enzyme (huntingtin interacting protein 2)